MLLPGDAVKADFPGAGGIKRRPCVVLTELYHSTRPDVMLAVVTTSIVIAPAMPRAPNK